MALTNERYEAAITLLNNGNPTKALPILEDLATTGHIGSMVHAANCYVNGFGTERNLDIARMHLQNAADAGSEIAIQLLALIEKADFIETNQFYWQHYG